MKKDRKSNTDSPPNVDFDLALRLAAKCYNDLHPEAKSLAWFNDCVTLGGFKNKQKQWVICYTAVPFAPLEEGLHWEKIGDRDVVVCVDPVTGERRIVISREGPPPIRLFEATIDATTLTVTVTVDEDISKLDGNQFDNGKPTRNY